jgi:uncharacterized membrane protein YhaH (DUF805 family)
MSQQNNTIGSMGFTGFLTIIFIILKLTHNISWSWWWVLSPLLINIGLIILLLLIIFILLFIKEYMEGE